MGRIMEASKNIKDFIGNCGICHLSILYTEDYVHLIEYKKGLKTNEWFYHRECFRKKLNGEADLKKLQGMAKSFLEKANTLVN